MDIYALTKAHSGMAYLVLLIYVIRGVMMLAGSTLKNSRAVLTIASVTTLALFGLGVFIAFEKDSPVLSSIFSLLGESSFLISLYIFCWRCCKFIAC